MAAWIQINQSNNVSLKIRITYQNEISLLSVVSLNMLLNNQSKDQWLESPRDSGDVTAMGRIDAIRHFVPSG